MGFYEIQQVVRGKLPSTFEIVHHYCERGPAQHRQGDLGSVVATAETEDGARELLSRIEKGET